MLEPFCNSIIILVLLFLVDGDLPGVGAVLGSHDFTPKETGTPCVFKVTRGDYSDLMALVVENLTKAEVKTEYQQMCCPLIKHCDPKSGFVNSIFINYFDLKPACTPILWND